jgi:hypothetical protein
MAVQYSTKLIHFNSSQWLAEFNFHHVSEPLFALESRGIYLL